MGRSGRIGLLGLAALVAALFGGSGCSVGTAGVVTPAAKAKSFGTDAYLAPSRPEAILRYADHPRGFAELRVPPGGGPFPIAVIFHGGCWKAGIATQAYMAPLATRWQELGIATLNVDYREVGDGGGWPGSFEDWVSAEGLLKSLVKDPRFDLSRLTFVGHSAGALPAQWLAATQGDEGPVGMRAPAFRARAIVFDGPADLQRDQPSFDALCEFSAVAPFMGGRAGEQANRYRAISPVVHPPGLDRLLFVQAKLPTPDSAALDALRANGVDVRVLSNPGASHFDIITPGAPVYVQAEAELLNVLRQP